MLMCGSSMLSSLQHLPLHALNDFLFGASPASTPFRLSTVLYSTGLLHNAGANPRPESQP
jgi:hypothetical protein